MVSQASFVGEGNWLKDYVDSLSKMMSFRGSGRFFIGSSRRNHVVVGVGDFDIEANTNGFGLVRCLGGIPLFFAKSTWDFLRLYISSLFLSGDLLQSHKSREYGNDNQIERVLNYNSIEFKI